MCMYFPLRKSVHVRVRTASVYRDRLIRAFFTNNIDDYRRQKLEQ